MICDSQSATISTVLEGVILLVAISVAFCAGCLWMIIITSEGD